MAREKKPVHRVQMTEGKRNIIHQLLEEYDIQTAEDIQDALKDLLGGTIKEMMEAEMDGHLGYEKSERSDSDDYRNGYKRKRVNSRYGSMEIDVPQDRKSTFEPQVVKKRQKDISDIDQKIISMYAKGMTTRQISETMEDIYGFEASEGFISDVTDKILPQIEDWQNRPLDKVLWSNESRYSTFIFEPVLGRGGYVFPHPDYYKQLFELLHKHKIVTIADEVQMGFYRTGKMWSFENYDICPDIIVFGKAISNGLWPLSGVWAKDDIISPNIWKTGSTHCTFAGHPLGTAIGMKTFQLIEEPKQLNKMQESSRLFSNVVERLEKEYPCVTRAHVLGHAAGIDICNPETSKPASEKVRRLVEVALTKPYIYEGEKCGLILTAGGFYNASLMLSPSVFISSKELDIFYNLFHYYMDDILKYN